MVHLQCRNCGHIEENKSAKEFINKKWGRIDGAFYCPECAAHNPKIDTDPLHVAMGLLDELSSTIIMFKRYIDDFTS